MKVEYQMAEKSTVIDPATAEHIELLHSLGPKRNNLSLFGILNKCKSQIGVRLLRSNLYQPPIDEQVIKSRLELVEEMIEDLNFFNSIRSIISRFPDLDPVLNLCVKKPELSLTPAQIDTKIDRMISLKQILQLLPMLHDIVSRSESRLCVEATQMLTKHIKTSSLLLEMMQLVLLDNVTGGRGAGAARFSRAMAVRYNFIIYSVRQL